MKIRQIVRYFFSTAFAFSFFANTAWADVCQNMQAKISRGETVQKEEAEAVSAELSRDKSNPFKQFVAGEVLSSLGLNALARDHFQAADSLQKDYVLTRFRQEFETESHTVANLFMYVQEKYPHDPALLLYLARRHLAEFGSSNEAHTKNIKTAREELVTAINLKDPWTGTFALLAMLEYNQVLKLPHGPGVGAGLNLSVKYANEELKRHADDPLALKVRLLALLKRGCEPTQLKQALTHAVKVMPADPELNLILGRMYLDEKNYQAAIAPVLTGLLHEHDYLTTQEACQDTLELIKKAERRKLLECLNRIISDPTSNILQTTLLRIRISDLFAMTGDLEESRAQLEIAMKMSPRFQTIVALKLGRQLASLHRYYEAYPYLDIAGKMTLDPNSADKIRAFRNRVALVRYNSPRDIALKIKTLISSEKPRS